MTFVLQSNNYGIIFMFLFVLAVNMKWKQSWEDKTVGSPTVLHKAILNGTSRRGAAALNKYMFEVGSQRSSIH